MSLEEVFEHGVSMVKTVWHKRDGKLSRHDVKRLIVTDVRPRSHIEVKDKPDAADQS